MPRTGRHAPRRSLGDPCVQLPLGARLIPFVILAAALACSRPASPLQGITHLSAGPYSNCAQLSGGEVRCWGFIKGQSPERRAVEVPALKGMTHIVLGDFFGCGLLGSRVRCWGSNRQGQLGDGTKTEHAVPLPVAGAGAGAQLSVHRRHVCAAAGGKVSCWGARSGRTFEVDDGSPTPKAVGFLEGVDAVTVGEGSNCARLGGTLQCWDSRDLAAGAKPLGELNDVAEIDLGGHLSCVRRISGEVRCWRSVGKVVATVLNEAASLGVGMDFACALGRDGSVSCWGDNSYGQLGDGTLISRAKPKPVAGLAGVVQLAVGDAHACVLLADTTARCWGINDGRLGDGTRKHRSTPVTVVE